MPPAAGAGVVGVAEGAAAGSADGGVDGAAADGAAVGAAGAAPESGCVPAAAVGVPETGAAGDDPPPHDVTSPAVASISTSAIEAVTRMVRFIIVLIPCIP